MPVAIKLMNQVWCATQAPSFDALRSKTRECMGDVAMPCQLELEFAQLLREPAKLSLLFV